jgi:nuclear pore complex protein Nup188
VLDDLDSGEFTSWEPSSYILNSTLIETITNVFGFAKQLGPSPATPPAFAWAIITWRLTAQASSLEQERDLLIEAQVGSRDSIPGPTPLEEAVLSLTRLENSELFDKKLPFQDLAETCSKFGVMELITQLVNLGMSAFGTKVDQISRDTFRLLLLQLLRAALSSEIVAYSPELIVSAHAIMTGDRTFRKWIGDDARRHADPVVDYFAKDPVLSSMLLNEARFRYPYELTPFLKFFSVLTRGERSDHDGMPTVADELATTNTLMQRLPNDFKDYISIREDENANYIALSVDLPQFAVRPKSSFKGPRRLLASSARAETQESMLIPARTEGNIVDDRAQPFVAIWNYPHSALQYLIQLLSTYVHDNDKVEYASQQPVSLENATEIVGLLTDLLHSSLRSSVARGEQPLCSDTLLEALDIGIDRNQDTVTVVLTVFEQELLHLSQEPGHEGSLELLVNCTHFLQALVVIAPNRVWPWLVRSRLLETDGNGGSLASILIGTEMVLGRYDFLIGCIRLFEALVKDAVYKSVARQAPSKALTRFNGNASKTAESGTSDRIISNTLLIFGRTLASIFEGSLNWKYDRTEHRLEINIGICRAFHDILKLAYGVDDSPDLSSKLTKIIAPIAEYITELYLSKSENDLPTNPILASLLSGADLDKNSLLTSSATLWKEQTHSTLLFSQILVRVAILLNKPWTHLEQQLFKATPLLARLYALNDGWKSPVLLLLESLVRGAVRDADSGDMDTPETKKNQQEPPSLLGHLGPRTAKNFLSILSQLGEPLEMVEIQTDVWNLLSTVVTCKQQWFALYLLTGNTPRETLRSRSKAESAPSRNQALLSRAIDGLSKLDVEKPTRFWPLYTSMLQFVSFSLNNWSWAMGDLRQHKDFIQKLLVFLKWLGKQPKELKTDIEVWDRSLQIKFASVVCEILAMYLHNARQINDITPLKDIVPSLKYLEENALRLPAYNVSLHSNLKKNLAARIPGVTLANLKRTTLNPETFGHTFFYDVAQGDNLLGFDTNWTGSRTAGGFRAEVLKANFNIGLVESQVLLLQNWKLLAVELGEVMTKDERLTKILIKVVEDCMVANAKSNLPEALFGQLMVVRADLAFVLLKRMAREKVKVPEMRRLLSPIWDAMRASTPDFDTVFSSDDVHYYRTLLKILYLSLQFFLLPENDSSKEASLRSSFRGTLPSSSKTLVEPVSNLLLEILSDTVAKGFQSLATQLHSEPSSVSPSDFALLTALLQNIIAVPEMKMWQAQAALLFSNSNTMRFATSLFSWSDRLTISHNGVDDPIYGELSLLFILSVSSIDALAETMAVEGILSQLNTANLMNYYRRRGGVSPFDSPARLHSIWTKGILPLCLNLLHAVGPAIAGEISSFLNQFTEQLKRASNALDSRTATKISLSVASEIQSLALISSILDGYRLQGPRVAVVGSEIAPLDWDKEGVKEDIESWMARKGALRECIVVVDEAEERLFNRKLAGDDPENELEAGVVEFLDAAGLCLGLGKSAQ